LNESDEKSIAKKNMTKKRLWLIPLVIFLIIPMVDSKDARALSGPQSSAWWRADWHYRIKVEVQSGRFERNDEPVELTVNFESLFSQSGIPGTLDTNSLRVIDQAKTPREVLSQFEPTSGEIIWLTGSMDADTSKTYYVYFDSLENGPKSCPGYYNTMKNGGILILPAGGFFSVIYKIGGREYETARIDEATGEIGYLKPPFGSPLIDGEGSFLGFKMKEGMFEGGAVSITGGPIRYRLDFHYEPRAPKSAIAYSDYGYTFYYVSNGQEVRTRFGNRWAASQCFFPQYHGAEWPEAFGIQGENPGRLETAFLATAIDAVTLCDVPTTWGPLDGDAAASPDLADNFWGVYGENGGIGIIPISPNYSSLDVDGYRSNDSWNWSVLHKPPVDFIEKGTYGWAFWIYGYIQQGWDLARDFGNRAEEPITIEADLNLSLATDAGSHQKAKIDMLMNREVPAYSGLEGKTDQSDPQNRKFKVAWLGPDWTYRKSLTFNNSNQSENLINFPVLVILTPGNFDYSHCQSDGRDIRFVDADDTTGLKYQIEEWNYNGDSTIWIKVPQIDGSSSTDYIWMYYGNPAAADGQDAENVWETNYVAVWHLGEGGTGTRYDSTINNNDGIPQNYDGDEAVAGAIDGADELDGINDYVQISGSDIGTTSVSVETWVKFNALDATTFSPVSGANPGGTVFSTRELDGHQSPTLCVSPGSGGVGTHKGAIFTFDSAGDARGAKGQTAIQMGQWYYMVGVFEYTGVGAFYGNWNIYVNGNRDNPSANNFNFAGSISMPFNGTPWRIGDQNQWTDGETNAVIDELRLSNIARSADWIAAQYRSMSNNFITFGDEAFATKIRIEDRADGTGVEIDTRTVASGASFTGYAISRDASDNFVDNVAVTWSLINRTGGVADSDLVAAGDTRSATFTGHASGTGTIRAQHATLGEDTTGVITVGAGTATRIRIEDSADGSGAEIDTRTIASGANFTGYAISRDASDNFVANVAVTWSLINRTGGVVDSDLVAAGDMKSATFTGHAAGTGTIRAQHATQGEDTTGVITVTVGTATGIRIENRADGSGVEIDTRTVASGASFTGYAISRDASDNFVANVAVTWSLINRTGGVAVSDLVAAGDTRSATFTGHAAGTGTIRAQHATLGSDSTGVITVTAGNQPPVALFKFEPKTGSPPCEICFDASSSYDPDGHIVSYDWSFGDGSAGDGANTCHTYTCRGDFLVTLKVTDNDGLSDTATAQIKLQAAVYPPINILLKREINRSLFRKEAFHTISWSFNPGNSSLTIVSYRIYRKEAGNGNESFQLIGTVSGDAFAYVDGYLDVYKKFIYAVTAVESSGHESQFSSLVGN
jgi:hypothetical protein